MEKSIRTLDARELAHDRLGEEFGDLLSQYDTQRRLEVLIDDFLPATQLSGKRVLDVGCGLGFFAQRLVERGALVTACDLGPNLVEITRQRVKCACEVVDALALVERFGPESFDGVVSSECIEHTPDPLAAVRQMARVLKPGGFLSISTPNLAWLPVVRLATILRLRPFDGLENFSTWSGLRRCLKSEGLKVEREFGLHLFPFQLPLHSLSRWTDKHAQFLRWGMINICLLAQKPAAL